MPKRVVLPDRTKDELYQLIYSADTNIVLKSRTYNVLMRNHIRTVPQLIEVLPSLVSGKLKIRELGKNGIALLQNIT